MRMMKFCFKSGPPTLNLVADRRNIICGRDQPRIGKIMYGRSGLRIIFGNLNKFVFFEIANACASRKKIVTDPRQFAS